MNDRGPWNGAWNTYIKMLASTVQFSNNRRTHPHRTPTPTTRPAPPRTPRHNRKPRKEEHASDGQGGTHPADDPQETPDHTPKPHTPAHQLKQQPARQKISCDAQEHTVAGCLRTQQCVRSRPHHPPDSSFPPSRRTAY